MTHAYWWPDIPNFGDRLTPLLLDRFADLHVTWAAIEHARVVAVGSILEHIPPSWPGVIVGAGKLLRDSTLTLDAATVLAVRGPLSARGLGDVAVGEPALLADELVDVATRDYDLGIVPHWSDTRLAHDHRFEIDCRRAVISPWGDPLDVVRAIGRCKKIVTSSLHGAVLADAFGIPRRIEVAHRFDADPKEGGMFKFEDYHASINLPFRIGELQTADPNYVGDRKDELWDALRTLKAWLPCG